MSCPFAAVFFLPLFSIFLSHFLTTARFEMFSRLRQSSRPSLSLCKTFAAPHSRLFFSLKKIWRFHPSSGSNRKGNALWLHGVSSGGQITMTLLKNKKNKTRNFLVGATRSWRKESKHPRKYCDRMERRRDEIVIEHTLRVKPQLADMLTTAELDWEEIGKLCFVIRRICIVRHNQTRLSPIAVFTGAKTFDWSLIFFLSLFLLLRWRNWDMRP